MSTPVVRFAVHKLVRDRIPMITQDERVLIQTQPLDDAAFMNALKEKLIEEAVEVKETPLDELVYELADVKEVMEALMACAGITPEQLKAVQDKKKEKRGAFQKRIFITYLDAPTDSKAYEYMSKDSAKYPVVPQED